MKRERSLFLVGVGILIFEVVWTAATDRQIRVNVILLGLTLCGVGITQAFGDVFKDKDGKR